MRLVPQSGRAFGRKTALTAAHVKRPVLMKDNARPAANASGYVRCISGKYAERFTGTMNWLKNC